MAPRCERPRAGWGRLPALAWTIAVGLVVGLAVGFASPARADELSDFERARALYEDMEYDRAIDAFLELVGSEPPRLRNALLVLESRKYLAAALVFADRKDEARQQFRALLRAEPDYTIDPLAFPAEVVKLFEDVKKDLTAEIRQRERAEAREKARERAAREAVVRERRARLRALRELAQEEQVERKNSRWLATVPFGVGQIQNGDRALGRFLAVTEALLLVASVTTWAVHSSLEDGGPVPTDLAAAEQLERSLRIANYVSFGSFVGLATYGVADAHIRFEPSRKVTRERELPEDLDRWIEAELAGGGVRLRF